MLTQDRGLETQEEKCERQLRKRGTVNVKQQEMQHPAPELVAVNQDGTEMHVVNTNRNEV